MVPVPVHVMTVYVGGGLGGVVDGMAPPILQLGTRTRMAIFTHCSLYPYRKGPWYPLTSFGHFGRISCPSAFVKPAA